MSAVNKSLVFAALFLGVFASAPRAQGLLTFNVPFDFVVNHEKLAAGQYSLRPAEVLGATFIRSTTKGPGALAATMPAGSVNPAGDTPALVFTRYENRYVLAQIWQTASDGRQVQGIPTIRRNARAAMQNGPSEPEVYVIAANR